MGSTPPEDVLDFWREDPLLNDHHHHWHLVYPAGGRPSPSGPASLGDRHGELFAYMHQQMIARYDAEHLAVGLSRVQPFDDYRAEIDEGYDPETWLWNGAQWFQFGPRPAGAAFSDVLDEIIGEQETHRDRILEAAATGNFVIGNLQVPVGVNNLGNTAEASLGTVDESGDTYGSLHNTGHGVFAFYDNEPPPGVMARTATAVRDPIFWRWHKHVDSAFHDWQETQQPHDFSEGPR